MGRCTTGVSQFVLLATNTLIFMIAAGGIGVSIYVYFDIAAKALTRMSLLMVILIASVALILFSILGCKTALNPPQKKCSRCLYLTILLILFLAEFVAAGYIFNINNALQVAKDHNFDIQGGVNREANDALVFLHNQLNDLYVSEDCKGGAAVSDVVPFNFTEVHCKSEAADQAFHSLFQNATISNEGELYTYRNCTQDPALNYAGSSSEFTQAYCGSEANIISLVQKYARYLVWVPVMLAALTFILLVSTVCLIAMAKGRERRMRESGLHWRSGQQEPLRRPFQMAGP